MPRPSRPEPTLYERLYPVLTVLWGSLLLLALVLNTLEIRWAPTELLLHRITYIAAYIYYDLAFWSERLLGKDQVLALGAAISALLVLLGAFPRLRPWPGGARGFPETWDPRPETRIFRRLWALLYALWFHLLLQGALFTLIWGYAGQKPLFWKLFLWGAAVYTGGAWCLRRRREAWWKRWALAGVVWGLGWSIAALFVPQELKVLQQDFLLYLWAGSAALAFMAEVVYPSRVWAGWGWYGELSLLGCGIGAFLMTCAHAGVVTNLPPPNQPGVKHLFAYSGRQGSQLRGYYEVKLLEKENALFGAGGYTGEVGRFDLATGEVEPVYIGLYAQRLTSTQDGQIAAAMSAESQVAWYRDGNVTVQDVLPECQYPAMIKTDPSTGWVWLGCEDTGSLLAINPATHRKMASYAFPRHQYEPYGPAFDPARHRVYMCDFQRFSEDMDYVYWFDSRTAQPGGKFPVDRCLVCLAYSEGTGRLYAACMVRSSVYVADPGTGKVLREIPVPIYPRDLSVWEEKGLLAVTSYYEGLVSVFHITPNGETLLQTFHVGSQVRGVSFEGSGPEKRLFATSMLGVFEIDASGW